MTKPEDFKYPNDESTIRNMHQMNLLSEPGLTDNMKHLLEGVHGK